MYLKEYIASETSCDCMVSSDIYPIGALSDFRLKKHFRSGRVLFGLNTLCDWLVRGFEISI